MAKELPMRGDERSNMILYLTVLGENLTEQQVGDQGRVICPLCELAVIEDELIICPDCDNRLCLYCYEAQECFCAGGEVRERG